MWAFLRGGPGAKGAPWCQCGANLPGRCAGTVLARLSMGCMSTRLLSAAEVAEMLGVPTSWVYEQSRQGASRRWRSGATAASARRRSRGGSSSSSPAPGELLPERPLREAGELNGSALVRKRLARDPTGRQWSRDLVRLVASRGPACQAGAPSPGGLLSFVLSERLRKIGRDDRSLTDAGVVLDPRASSHR
jgi:hypothetical protein